MPVEVEKSIVETVATAVGFIATCELCARFGGRTFYVPSRASSAHILSLFLGNEKSQKLSAMVGGQTIELPMLREVSKKREIDIICRKLAAGESDRQILLTSDISMGNLKRIKNSNSQLIAAYVEMMDKQNSFIKTVK